MLAQVLGMRLQPIQAAGEGLQAGGAGARPPQAATPTVGWLPVRQVVLLKLAHGMHSLVALVVPVTKHARSLIIIMGQLKQTCRLRVMTKAAAPTKAGRGRALGQQLPKGALLALAVPALVYRGPALPQLKPLGKGMREERVRSSSMGRGEVALLQAVRRALCVAL